MLVSRRVRREKRRASRTVLSCCGVVVALVVFVGFWKVREAVRRERRRDQNSEVSCGRVGVEGPEAWRIRERVFR